ncbi:glycosyltransferase family 4 protein [Planctomycetales bacterium ZRK34]|nr:glycosyltransferase family 4 protein [Planctomycetales bacterium ZRK34]
MNLTYSGMFYDVCSELGAEVRVIGYNAREAVIDEGPWRIEQAPVPGWNDGGWRYHRAELRLVMRLWRAASEFKPDVLVMTDIKDWFLVTLLRLRGIRIIPTMHGALWPVGFPPRGFATRLIEKFNAMFWRHAVDATLCVSPECERQVRQISGKLDSPFFQARAQYVHEDFATVTAPKYASPLVVLYAGRLERAKGPFELLDVASRLNQSHPRKFRWEFAGGGTALEAFRQEVQSRGLESSVVVHGMLKRPQMLEAFNRSHIVAVPTSSTFREGLNKVVVESVVARRPVLTSALSNALDVVGEAVCEVPPDNIAAYGDELIRLAEEPDYWQRKRDACETLRMQFFDRDRSWGAALRGGLEHVMTELARRGKLTQ